MKTMKKFNHLHAITSFFGSLIFNMAHDEDWSTTVKVSQGVIDHYTICKDENNTSSVVINFIESDCHNCEMHMGVKVLIGMMMMHK